MKELHVVCAIVQAEERVLIARRAEGQSNAGLWEFPGGKIEAGEAPQMALQREMKEEFGADGLTGAHLCDSHYSDERMKLTLSAFFFHLFTPELQLRVHDEIRFVNAQELPACTLSPADVPIAQAVANRLSAPSQAPVLSYEPADRTDIDALFALNRALILQYEDLSSLQPEEVLRWVHRKLAKRITEYTRILVNGKKAGYFHFAPSGGKMELDDLYVFPMFRGQGVGTQVIRRCLAQTHLPVFLYVFNGNTRAIALYSRLGFTLREAVGDTRCMMETVNKTAGC